MPALSCLQGCWRAQKGSAGLVPGRGVKPSLGSGYSSGQAQSIPRAGLSPPSSAVPSLVAWGARGGGGGGGRHTTVPAGPAWERHSKPGAVESGDQHEKEMENKEQ